MDDSPGSNLSYAVEELVAEFLRQKLQIHVDCRSAGYDGSSKVIEVSVTLDGDEITSSYTYLP